MGLMKDGAHNEVIVCDCHTWPTGEEMHAYVEVLEKRVKELEIEVRQRGLV
mgnify:CR=1 FL=1